MVDPRQRSTASDSTKKLLLHRETACFGSNPALLKIARDMLMEAYDVTLLKHLLHVL